MNIIQIIEKKRDGLILTENEIKYFIKAYCQNEIADYQASALLMAICIRGMNKEETLFLTKAMLESGVQLNLNEITGVKVDKHSTGGVGDKISLILGPMCAACGLQFAKMSGRGLSHTGGTLDKLESIKGFTVNLPKEQFIKQVNDIHLSIIGQNESLVLADKKLYALRDVTGCVPSIPLIASSIMSKKLAAGADVILLDVKYGDGAFMKTKEDAILLAEEMISIGEGMKRIVKAEITNMNEPLGYAIGNSLEVKEAIDVLNGKGPSDVRNLCIHSGATLLLMSNMYSDYEEAKKRMQNVLDNKEAYLCFLEMVKAQNGCVIEDQIEFVDEFVYCKKIYSPKSGYVKHIKTKDLGLISCALGAGRFRKEDPICFNAGIVITKKISDFVEKNELLMTAYSNKEIGDDIIDELISCYEFSDSLVSKEKLIYKIL